MSSNDFDENFDFYFKLKQMAFMKNVEAMLEKENANNLMNRHETDESIEARKRTLETEKEALSKSIDETIAKAKVIFEKLDKRTKQLLLLCVEGKETAELIEFAKVNYPEISNSNIIELLTEMKILAQMIIHASETGMDTSFMT